MAHIPNFVVILIMKIPIVIVNWNGYEDTVECLQSVLASSYQDFVIHLVDNGSENEEGDRLKVQFDSEERVHVILKQKNDGFTRANNDVLRQILSGDCTYVVLLNNDTTVDAKWLETLVEFAVENQGDMISSLMLNYFDRDIIDNLGHQMLTTGEIVPLAHGRFLSERASSENFGACAGAALYATDMLRDVGIFDEYFSTGYEDAELGMRAVVAGYNVVNCPNARVYHKMGRSVKKIFDESYSLMIQRCIWYSFVKTMPWILLLISLPFVMIKQVLLTLVSLVFLRWNYLRVQWKALYWFAREDLWLANTAHAYFFTNRSTVSTFSILRRQTFFLWFDIRRFCAIFLRRRKSALDHYGAD